MKIFFLLLSFMLLLIRTEAAPKKILFIGNSITYFNNMPQVFEQIADEKGDSVSVTMYAPGGTGFQNHYVDPNVFTHFREGDWDIIVLQPGSNESVGIPPTQPRATTLEQARTLIDSALIYNPCARIVFYEISYGVWGSGNAEIQQYNNTMNEIRITNTYLADSTGLSFVPAGEALRYVWNQDPSVLLWGSAGDIHPNIKGSYLISCAFYSALFSKPSFGTTVYNGNTMADAVYYQRVADSIVLNHPGNWRIDSARGRTDFSYTVNGNRIELTATAPAADSIGWIINGASFTEPELAYTFQSAGSYPVSMIAYFGTCRDTVAKVITVGAPTGINELKEEAMIRVYPNPAVGMAHIELPPDVKTFLVTIRDLYGRTLLRVADRKEIDMKQLAGGIYMVTLEDRSTGKQYAARIVNRQ